MRHAGVGSGGASLQDPGCERDAALVRCPQRPAKASHDHVVHARAAAVRRGVDASADLHRRASAAGGGPGRRHRGVRALPHERRRGAVADYIPVLRGRVAGLVRDLRGRRPGQVVRDRRRRRRRSRSRACPSRSCSRWSARRSGTARPGSQLGVNSTGFPFDSLMAVELNEDRHDEPAGQRRARWPRRAWSRARPRTRSGSGSAADCRASPAASSAWTRRSTPPSRPPTCATRGSPTCSQSYGRLYFDPDEATDVYTRQCSLEVTVHDLAVMAATLANGGVNPVTGERVVAPRRVPPGAGGDGHRRPLRAVGRLALRDRDPRQERRQRRHRHGVAGQGRPGHLLAAAGRRGQQRARPAGDQVPRRTTRAATSTRWPERPHCRPDGAAAGRLRGTGPGRTRRSG